MCRVLLVLICLLFFGCTTQNGSLGEGNGQVYVLTLEGFGPNTRAEFEGTISHFEEYRSHALIDENNEIGRYEYNLTLTPSEFRDTLADIIARLELPATLRYAGKFRFEIIRSRKKML